MCGYNSRKVQQGLTRKFQIISRPTGPLHQWVDIVTCEELKSIAVEVFLEVLFFLDLKNKTPPLPAILLTLTHAIVQLNSEAVI